MPTSRARYKKHERKKTPAAYNKAFKTIHPRSNIAMASVPLVPMYHAPPRRQPAAAQSNGSMTNAGLSAPTQTPYEHIQEMASKRISTLDYLRKANEGRVYWFNTHLFGKKDLAKMPHYQPNRLARRATNYLLLGFSLPSVLDMHSQPTEYLRALNNLLAEFETYQSVHNPDAAPSSSLNRSRLPQMFKRATTSKGRRTSSAANDLIPNFDDAKSPLDIPEPELLPGEHYELLQTHHIPFEPDFTQTYATLTDCLIDIYTKVMDMVNGPDGVAPGVHELFLKADSKIRKILVANVVRDFEEASRQSSRSELAGVGKVVLAGLQ
ncbi:hypothetical protein M501DRAFT_607434 [Patellaria atrata CBS 101060]|uniref:Uncharacterized protein n=1 Tax=Patellaria atrata CBS 101060 TaxID=1346257 RepID=A0A9P4SD59_9PEZI|nr:hypothetical protein M501DRAFT_607434 [Patellaria atrata CBS 101060]